LDLADYIAQLGEDAAERLLRAAPAVHAAPEPIDGSAAAVRELVERAIEDACAGSVVMVQVPPGVGKSWHAERLALEVASGSMPVPVHGRRPAGWVGAWPPVERRVVLALQSHGLCEEKAGGLQAADPGARVVHLEGALRACLFADKVRELYPTVGRRGICGEEGTEERCEHADTCPGARMGEVGWGEVAVAPHAMAPTLTADVTILDESPPVLSIDVVEDWEIRTLFAGSAAPRARSWRRRNPEAPAAASAVAFACAAVADAHRHACEAGKASPFAKRITGGDLVDLLQGASVSMVQLLGEAFGSGAPLPPAPLPSQARAGIGRSLPSRAASRAMRGLYRWLAGDGNQDTIEGERIWPSLVCRPDGSWAFELRTVAPLPKGPVVVLDATARHAVEEWRAAYPDRSVVVRSLDVAGTAPARSVSYRTRALTRGRLIRNGEPTVTGCEAVRRAVEAAVAEVERARPLARKGERMRIAVLTHRPIAPIVEGLTVGADLAVGYYGRDDRATNAFRDVAGIVLLGEPTENIGAVGADAAALGLDADAVSRARTAATLEQSIARARHIRRHASDRAVLIHVGASPPAVPGVAWEQRELVLPVAGGALSLSDARTAGEWLATREGVVGEAVLRRADLNGTPWQSLGVHEAPEFLLARAAAMVAERRGWSGRRVRLGERDVLVYEGTPGAAEHARRGRGVGRL